MRYEVLKYRKIIIIILTLFLVTGCSNNINNVKEENKQMEKVDIKLTINGKNYNVIWENNETVNAFIATLPKDFSMSELNGNEKYVYMDDNLPTKAYVPEEIKAGDIMLYGNDCLVIFYKTFKTQYSYTKIGHIDNLPDLGTGNIVVNFAK